MHDQEKQLLCDYYDKLTPNQRRIALASAAAWVEKNKSKRPTLRLVSSANLPQQPSPAQTQENPPESLAAFS